MPKGQTAGETFAAFLHAYSEGAGRKRDKDEDKRQWEALMELRQDAIRQSQEQTEYQRGQDVKAAVRQGEMDQMTKTLFEQSQARLPIEQEQADAKANLDIRKANQDIRAGELANKMLELELERMQDGGGAEGNRAGQALNFIGALDKNIKEVQAQIENVLDSYSSVETFNGQRAVFDEDLKKQMGPELRSLQLMLSHSWAERMKAMAQAFPEFGDIAIDAAVNTGVVPPPQRPEWMPEDEWQGFQARLSARQSGEGGEEGGSGEEESGPGLLSSFKNWVTGGRPLGYDPDHDSSKGWDLDYMAAPFQDSQGVLDMYKEVFHKARLPEPESSERITQGNRFPRDKGQPLANAPLMGSQPVQPGRPPSFSDEDWEMAVGLVKQSIGTGRPARIDEAVEEVERRKKLLSGLQPLANTPLIGSR